jgi:hypothetical protein
MLDFNKSFGTSYRGELLSVGYEQADTRDGTSKLLTLWKSSKIMGEIGEGPSKQKSRHLSELLKICRLLPQVWHLLVGLLLKCLAEKVHEFACSFDCIFIFFLITHKFCNLLFAFDFLDFEELLRSYPASRIEEY